MRDGNSLSRRDFLQVVAASTVTLLAACSPVASPASTGGQAAEGAHIVFASYTWEAFTPILDDVVAAFTKDNPTVAVEKQFAGWSDYWQKTQAEVAAGSPPDVGIMSVAYIADFATKEMLLALQPQIDKDGIDLNRYWKTGIDVWRIEPGAKVTGSGTLYGLPLDSGSNSCLYYNKTMFDKAGLGYPSDDWTWDDVLKAALTLTKAGSDPQTSEYGLNAPTDVDGGANTLIWQWGGDVINADYSKSLLDQQEAMTALKWIYDLIYTHKVSQVPNPAITVDPFMSGKIAMQRQGSWQATTYKDIKDFEWDIAHWPRSPITKERIVEGEPDGWSIFTGTKAPDAAWNLLKFIAGPDGGGTKIFASRFSNIPGVKELAQSDSYLNQAGLPANFKRIIEDLDHSKLNYSGRGWAKWTDAMGQDLGGAWLGELALDAAVTKATADINKVLQGLS